MSDYTEVEQPFLHQLQNLGWDNIDQGQDIPSDPGKASTSIDASAHEIQGENVSPW